jgi:hypothetical protein
MDLRLRPHLERDEIRRAPIRVRLLVWGVTHREQNLALSLATRGDGRTTWQFATVHRHDGATCPFSTSNTPTALAVERGHDWAYAAYREGTQP